VVNFILKSNYQGAEVNARAGWSTEAGNYTERSASVVAGVGRNGLHLTLSGNWTKNTPLFQKDRSFSHSITGRNAIIAGAIGSGTLFPTHLLSPALNSPGKRNPVGTAATATTLNALVANAPTGSPISRASPTAMTPRATPRSSSDRSRRPPSSAPRWSWPAGNSSCSPTRFWENQEHLSAPRANDHLHRTGRRAFNPLTIAFPRIGFSYLPAPLQYTEDSKSTWAAGGLRGELNPKWSWEAAHT